MLSHDKAVILKVDELTLLLLRMGDTSSEDGNTRIRPNAIEGIRIEGDHSLKCMLLEDILLNLLLYSSLPRNGRLGYDDNSTSIFTERIQQVLRKGNLIFTGSSLLPCE